MLMETNYDTKQEQFPVFDVSRKMACIKSCFQIDQQMRRSGPTAQSVERWIPCDETGVHVPVTKIHKIKALQSVGDIYEPPDGFGCGWWQAVPRRRQ